MVDREIVLQILVKWVRTPIMTEPELRKHIQRTNRMFGTDVTYDEVVAEAEKQGVFGGL